MRYFKCHSMGYIAKACHNEKVGMRKLRVPALIRQLRKVKYRLLDVYKCLSE